uniref:Uncharacterized protein n=2 Tax=Dendroctonus ponderosae TaxID=77166 RepID=A0AAR5PV58_DENPD
MPDQESIETTRLLHTHQPPYVFGSSLARKRRVRQFQCCLWSILLVGFLASLVITIAYTTNLPVDAEKETASTSNETDLISVDTFITLFNNTWPLEDQVEMKTNDRGNWDHAMQEGEMFLESKDSIEKNASSLPIDSPSYRHQRVMGTSDKARELSRKGYQLEGAARFLYGNQTKSRKEFTC